MKFILIGIAALTLAGGYYFVAYPAMRGTTAEAAPATTTVAAPAVLFTKARKSRACPHGSLGSGAGPCGRSLAPEPKAKKAPAPAAPAPAAAPATPASDAASSCQVAAGLAIDIASNPASDLYTMSDAVTKARDICESARSILLDEDKSDDAHVWGGVDRIKSGLNALLEFIDTGATSKVIEARDKIAEGNALLAQ